LAINKIYPGCDSAVADIPDGAVVMIGGFGSQGGLPINLIAALGKQAHILKEAAPDLTAIKNKR